MATAGTSTRLSLASLIAGIGGIVLIISLFLPWISIGGLSASGWERTKFVDIVLLVMGLLGIGSAASGLPGRQVRLPFGLPRALQVLGIVATSITGTALIEGSSQG